MAKLKPKARFARRHSATYGGGICLFESRLAPDRCNALSRISTEIVSLLLDMFEPILSFIRQGLLPLHLPEPGLKRLEAGK